MKGTSMRASSNRFRPPIADTEPPIVLTDDGGSGLLEACKRRFAAPAFEVACDARHTVWIKRSDGLRSFGLPPWLLRTQSMDEILEAAEEKLGLVHEVRQ
jgi:hypothetical protein